VANLTGYKAYQPSNLVYQDLPIRQAINSELVFSN